MTLPFSRPHTKENERSGQNQSINNNIKLPIHTILFICTLLN